MKKILKFLLIMTVAVFCSTSFISAKNTTSDQKQSISIVQKQTPSATNIVGDFTNDYAGAEVNIFQNQNAVAGTTITNRSAGTLQNKNQFSIIDQDATSNFSPPNLYRIENILTKSTDYITRRNFGKESLARLDKRRFIQRE